MILGVVQTYGVACVSKTASPMSTKLLRLVERAPNSCDAF